jgi:sarcosine oxidase, subunit gamma
LRPRFGCKGPGAQAWLVTEGYRVPAAANSVVIDGTGVLVARLATSEFLIEAVEGGAGRVASNQQQLTDPVCPADVYPVARQDLVIAVEGAAINTLLRQICSFDFAPLLEHCEREAGPIVFTSMVGVSVLALVRRVHVRPVLTLWVDPTFAHYFWTTLLQVGSDLGGINVNATTGSME